MFDGDEVEAIAPSRLGTDGLFWELLPKCCHIARHTHGTGPSGKLSNIPYLRPTMVLAILVGTSGNVAAGTHTLQATDGMLSFPDFDNRDVNRRGQLLKPLRSEPRASPCSVLCDVHRIGEREHEHPRK